MGSRLPTTSFLSNLQQRPLQTQLSLKPKSTSDSKLGAHISRQPFALSQSPGRKLTETLNSPSALNAQAASQVWRATQLASTSTRTLSSHHPALDAELPGGGWPCRQVTELLLNAPASGEIRLLMPLLRELTHAGKNIAFIAPPHLFFGPEFDAQGLFIERLLIISSTASSDSQSKPQQVLTDLLLSAEQVLKSGQFEAVIVWCPKQVSPEQLRRLHHAASMSPGAVFVCRPLLAQFESSAAPLRISIGKDIVLCGDQQVHQAQPKAASNLLAQLAAFNAQQPKTQPTAIQTTTAQAIKTLPLQILKRRGPLLQKPIQLEVFSPASAPTAVHTSLPEAQKTIASAEPKARLSKRPQGFFLSGSFDQVMTSLEEILA